eukprot:6849826-Prymnesium_polylepis.1
MLARRTRLGALRPVVLEPSSPDRASHGGVVGLQRRVEPPPSGRGHAAAARCDPMCRNFHP